MHEIFNSYILRVPRLPLNFYFDLVQGKDEKYEIFKYFNNSLINEAVYIGSPHLYKALAKVCNGKETDIKKKEKIRLSFLKYLYRISSRTTPYGLFSGLSLGNFSNTSNNIIKIDESYFKRHSRLDIQVCFDLVDLLKKKTEIFENTYFYSNNSFYKVNKSVRYLEKILLNKKLTYQIVEILLDEYLSQIIHISRNGVTKGELLNFLTKSGDIERSEASFFIDELISSQILVNELELTVSGEEPLNHIIAVLEKRLLDSNDLEILKSISSKINSLDAENSNESNMVLYNEVVKGLKLIGLDKLPKDVFQVDSYFDSEENSLPNEVKEIVHEGLKVLRHFTNDARQSNHQVDEFKSQFYKRYDKELVKLMEVLDEEIGIGYPANTISGDSNPLLKGLIFNTTKNEAYRSSEWDSVDKLLFRKVIESENEGLDYIVIEESDLQFLPVSKKELSETFSSIVQIVNVDNEEKIHMPAVMGSSAASLMGRFGHGNKEVLSHIEEISVKERELNSNKIVAEIVHLAEKRLGNILMRPNFRKYEIPIATRSESDNEKTIFLDDLFIRYMDGKLVLWSKSRDKEVIPKLTNAHNYSSSTLPIYRFLSDFQYNEKIKNLSFYWGSLNDELKFFPRVYYKNLILSSSKWKIEVSELRFLMNNLKEDKIEIEFNIWREKKGIPKYFYLSNGDNKLLIYSLSKDALSVFLNEIKKFQTIIIEEFLFEEKSISQNYNNEFYTNEFIFSFYRKNETH